MKKERNKVEKGQKTGREKKEKVEKEKLSSFFMNF